MDGWLLKSVHINSDLLGVSANTVAIFMGGKNTNFGYITVYKMKSQIVSEPVHRYLRLMDGFWII